VNSSRIKAVFVAFLTIATAGFIFIWFGMFNVAANVKHWGITTTFLEWVRERSISSNVEDLAVPDISDKQLIAKGAGNYGAMCAQCHLAPGIKSSEMYKGLNPQPPAFHKGKIEKRDPKSTYWIINNGIKMTGMSAWGEFHTDQQIWELVAFVNALPEMNADTYKSLVGDGKHAHAGGGDDHGTNKPAQAKGAEGHHTPAASYAPVAPKQSTNGGQPAPFRQHTDHHASVGGPAPAAPVQGQSFDQSNQLPQGGSGHHRAGSSVAPASPGQSQYNDQFTQPGQTTGHHTRAAGSAAGTSQDQNNVYQPNGQTNNHGYHDNGHRYQGSNHGYQNYNRGYQGGNNGYQNNGQGYYGSGHGYQNNDQGYQSYGAQPYGSQSYDSQYYGSRQPQGYQQNDHGHHYK